MRRELDSTGRDSGAAMVTVILVAVLLGFLSVVMLKAVSTNLERASADRRSGRFTAEADGGVDRVIREIEAMGLAKLNSCTSYVPTTPTVDLALNPCTFQNTYQGGGGYEKYVAVVNPISKLEPTATPPTTTGTYKVISSVFDVNNDFVRQVEQTLRVNIVNFPVGIVARTSVDAGGTPNVFTESIYTGGNFTWRSKVSFTGTDRIYGGGAGVNAVGTIYERNGGAIHQSAVVDCDYPYDRDNLGGAVPAGSCAPLSPAPPASSLYTQADFDAIWDKNAITEDDYADLKARAQESGTYWVNPAGTIQDSDMPAGLSGDTIFYIEFTSGTAATNKVNWKASYGTCGSTNGILVIRNGSLRFNGNTTFVGMFLLPDAGSTVDKSNGNADLTGGLFADYLVMSGTMTFSMPECWAQNMPSVLTAVTPLHWRQVDR